MNKFLKLTLSFLFLFGLIQDNIIFAAAKIENISSSSTSSSSSSRIAPSSISHGEIMNALSGRQKKAAQEISKLEQFKHFPPGLIPLVMQYEDYNEDATKDLLDAIQNYSFDPKNKIVRIHKALKNGANPNNTFDSCQYFDSPLYHAINIYKKNVINHLSIRICYDSLIEEDIIPMLIKFGANVNAKTIELSNNTSNRMSTLVKIATPLSDLILIYKLQSIDAMLNQIWAEKNSKLIKIIGLLLKWINQTDLNIYISDPEEGLLTYLVDIATMNSDMSELVKLLLNYGANPNIGHNASRQTFKDLIQGKPAEKIYKNWEKEKEASSLSNFSSGLSSSSNIPFARIVEPFNYPGSPAPAPKDDKVALTIHQLRFLWDNVMPEQRKAWEDAGGPDVDPRTIKEIGKATVRIILG